MIFYFNNPQNIQQKVFCQENNKIMIILRCFYTPFLCFQIVFLFCREAQNDAKATNKKTFP